MMLFHLILVATIQGITEFLPVSSSGHLALIPNLTSLDDQGLVIDVFAHIGTLFAVILYFFRDVRSALAGLIDLIQWKIRTSNAKLATCLVIGTIPVVLLGFVFYTTGIGDSLRNLKVIGFTTLLFGIVLYVSDQLGTTDQKFTNWSVKDAFILSLFQMISLIPGTSRSGIVISGARLKGYNRSDATRISMLMSIPTILAAGTLSTIGLMQNPQPTLIVNSLIVLAISFVAALGALATMMKLIQSFSFTPFVIYRVILGVILLWVAYN